MSASARRSSIGRAEPGFREALPTLTLSGAAPGSAVLSIVATMRRMTTSAKGSSASRTRTTNSSPPILATRSAARTLSCRARASRDEGLVAGLVTVEVVQLLQVVDVDEQGLDALVVAVGDGEQRLGTAHETAAVADPGQLVDQGEPPELLDETGLALDLVEVFRDVMEDDADPQLAVFVDEHVRGDVGDEGRAVSPQERELGPVVAVPFPHRRWRRPTGRRTGRRLPGGRDG